MRYEPPSDWTRIRVLDAHTAGEPLRIILDGLPAIPGETILAKRRWAQDHLDLLRRALMLEPRGHAAMYGCIPTEPVTPDGHIGVLFLHNEGFSTMCGHGIIGLVSAGLQSGVLQLPADESEVRIDTPAGRVTARAHRNGDRVEKVSFYNVPSFLLLRDQTVPVAGIGDVSFDLAYGGAFYAYVDAPSIGLSLEKSQYARIVDWGREIKHAVMESTTFAHPSGDADLNFLYGVIFVEHLGTHVHSRNVCVFADGEVDRSPTGTGVSGRIAIHHARGEVPLGETITIESIVGTTFEVRAAEQLLVEDVAAVLPEVTGSAHITGQSEFYLDPADPLRYGFLLG